MNNTKKLVSIALLFALGIALRSLSMLIPIPGGISPDVLLITILICATLFRDKQSFIIITVAAAFFTALLTTFPYGQIINPIQMVITMIVIKPIINYFDTNITVKIVVIIVFIGTIISGALFSLLGGWVLNMTLLQSLLALFAIVVIPTAIFNAVLTSIIYPVINKVFTKL